MNNTVSESIGEVVGMTPLLHAKRLCKNPNVRFLIKLEYMNPSGSIKDRIVLHMLDQMERNGILKPGSVVIENSSGNTAAAVAMMCAVKGYRAILVVPHKCSMEKIAIIKAFGADVVVAEPGAAAGSPGHYEQIALRLVDEVEGAVRLDQYNNLANVEAHALTTGPEIWRQAGGVVDIFVAGASTGGTISGVSKFLKEKNPSVQTVLADPSGSALYNKVMHGDFIKSPGSTDLEGIGKSYPVDCTLFEYIDSAVQVSDYDAISTAHALARVEGVLAGMSGGANVAAALKIAETITRPTTIVTVIPDGGFKYLSKLYNEEWLKERELPVIAMPSTPSNVDVHP